MLTFGNERDVCYVLKGTGNTGNRTSLYPNTIDNLIQDHQKLDIQSGQITSQVYLMLEGKGLLFVPL